MLNLHGSMPLVSVSIIVVIAGSLCCCPDATLPLFFGFAPRLVTMGGPVGGQSELQFDL